MTFEEAKQKVAEKYTCSNWEELFFSSLSFEVDKYYSEAAELWQQSNLERIKELEDGFKEILKTSQGFGVDRICHNLLYKEFNK